MIDQIFCLKCKEFTNNSNIKAMLTKNYRPYISATCNICKKLKSKFVSKKEIMGNGVLSNLFKIIPILNKIF